MPININGTTGISGADGSAATPAIQGADTNTGIFFPAADTVAIATGGVERVRADSSGNVGIGTSSPSTRLEVSASGIPTLINSSNNQYVLQLSYASNTSKAYIGTFSNALIFAPSSGSEAARIDSSGNLRVGTTGDAVVSSERLSVLGGGIGLKTATSTPMGVWNTNASGNLVAFYVNAGSYVGGITTNGSSTTYATSSDYRLKEDVQPMAGALAKVAALKPCTYTWKADGSKGEGFIAHELQAVVPDAVVGEKDAVNEDGSIKPQGIDTSFLVATLTAAIQELNAKVDAQAVEIAALKGAA